MRRDSTSCHNNNGLDFFGVLAIVFIVLKLTGLIDWSWYWVLAPIWIPMLLVLVAFLAFKVLFGRKI